MKAQLDSPRARVVLYEGAGAATLDACAVAEQRLEGEGRARLIRIPRRALEVDLDRE